MTRSTQNQPRLGQIVKGEHVRGQDCRIIAIHPLGTIDVETLDGSRCYRISGLAFTQKGGRR